MYTSIELDHIAGKCRKLDGAIKFQTGLDFLILIHKPPFTTSNTLDKFRVVCHELYHIQWEKKHFKVRHHDGDFCEIAAHDKFSYALAAKALSILESPTVIAS